MTWWNCTVASVRFARESDRGGQTQAKSYMRAATVTGSMTPREGTSNKNAQFHFSPDPIVL